MTSRKRGPACRRTIASRFPRRRRLLFPRLGRTQAAFGLDVVDDPRHRPDVDHVRKLLESQLGDLDEAEVTLTQTYDDAKKIQKGELDANAAFMQGRVKVSGNMAKLMALLPLTSAPEYKELQKQIQEITEY